MQNVDVHQGIWIFLIDNITDNAFKQKILTNIYCLLLQIKKGYIIEASTIAKKIVFYLLKFLSLFVSANFLKMKIQKLQRLYQNKETNSLVDYSSVLFHK